MKYIYTEITNLNLKQITAPQDNKTKTLWLFCLILEEKKICWILLIYISQQLI